MTKPLSSIFDTFKSSSRPAFSLVNANSVDPFDVSVVDLTVNLKKSTNYEEVCLSMKKASEGELKGILGYTNEEVVVSNSSFDKGCYRYEMLTFSDGYKNYYFSQLELKDPERSNLRSGNEVIIGSLISSIFSR